MTDVTWSNSYRDLTSFNASMPSLSRIQPVISKILLILTVEDRVTYSVIICNRVKSFCLKFVLESTIRARKYAIVSLKL